MTDPKQSDNGWNLQDLPVLTEVVAESGDELEVPAFDFSAELDELARSLPQAEEPVLELPPELTLDDVLGEDELATVGDESALDASRLIESLPSLDLEVDMPGELTLDDVLPARPAPAVAEPVASGDDFDFELSAAAANDVAPAAEAGLDALFAKARFEPVLAVEDAVVPRDVLPEANVQDNHASLADLNAQLEQFAEPQEMPELPADAFLTREEPAVTLLTAAEPDPVWAESWRPAPVQETSESILELPLAHDALPVVDEVVANGETNAIVDAMPQVTANDAEAPVAVLDGSFHVSLDDLLQSLQPTAPLESPGNVAEHAEAEIATDAVALSEAALLAVTPTDNAQPEAATVSLLDTAVTEVADADWPLADDIGTAEWTAEPLAVQEASPVEAGVMAASEEVAGGELAADDGWPPDDGDDSLAAVEGADAEAFSEPESPEEPRPAMMPQSISLDSLPTGVLGGGLGLAAAAAAAAAAAQLGASAGSLPGGEGWPLRSQLRNSATERDVELDWARDLHAEPPQGAALQDEPEAMVMRSRRAAVEQLSPAQSLSLAPQLDDIPFQQIAAAELSPIQPPFTMAPAPESPAIRVEAVTPPLAVAPALGGVDEGALIEALYARVLPRMKVELTLWMQDALEQQAKQLISGVMQQMKEDFDMMLAQSLKESLREALDEVAPEHNKDN